MGYKSLAQMPTHRNGPVSSNVRHQMNRIDLSNRLIHLTRGETPEAAGGVFDKIVQQGMLIGGTGYIRGGFQCVCFSEAPLSALAQVLAANTPHGMRYAPFGVVVEKAWLFKKGGRPVIYQTHSEYELLHDAQKYRHVRYEPHLDCDHTWEREWRIRIDALQLNPYKTTFIVPTRKWVDKYQMQHVEQQLIDNHDSSMLTLQPPVWHFIVLEDLGVSISPDA